MSKVVSARIKSETSAAVCAAVKVTRRRACAARDGRITDGGNKNILRAKFCGGFDGFIFVANNNRNNGAAEF